MHIPCATYDPVPTPEIHLFSCVGASFTFYEHIDDPKHKISEKIFLGPISSNNPLGMGHDIGRGRPHVLLCLIVPKSPISSGLATASSSDSPQFSAHKCLVGVGGAKLPICTYPIPFVPMLEGMGCGSPVNLNLWRPNTVLGTIVGMTLGDLYGGFINMWCAGTFNTFNAIIGELAGKIPGLGKAEPYLSAGAGAAGFTVLGGSNLGSVFQQMIDNDGIDHDAKPELTVMGKKTEMKSYIEDPEGWNDAMETLHTPGMQATPEGKKYYKDLVTDPENVETLTTPGMQADPSTVNADVDPETVDNLTTPGMQADPAIPNWWDQ